MPKNDAIAERIYALDLAPAISTIYRLYSCVATTCEKASPYLGYPAGW